MNAAFLMLTSAWMAGADVEVTPAPVSLTSGVVSTGSSCSTGSCGGGCATACDDPCASKPGLFSRLKGKMSFGHKSCDTCAPAPAPVVVPHHVHAPAASTCDDGCSKPGLFSRLKGSFGKKSCGTGCETAAPCCGTAAVVGGCSTGSCASGISQYPGAITTPGQYPGVITTPGTTILPGTTTPVHPEVIPPPKKTTDDKMPKGGTTGLTIEPILTPVGAPKPIDLNGPKNPF